MRRTIKIIILFIILFNLNVRGQTKLLFTFNKTTYATLNDLWSIQISNSGKVETSSLKLKISLSEQKSDTELWSSESPVFMLSKTEENYNFNSFTKTHSAFMSDSFKVNYESKKMIPNGNYTLCITLVNPEYDILITTICDNFTIQNQEEIARKKNIFDRWGISIGGNVQIQTFNSWGSANRPQYPPNYVQVYGSPTISLFNIPLQINTLLNFPDYQFSPSSSRVSVNFDSEQYKSKIRKKTADYIADKYDVKKILPTGQQALINDLKRIETIITNKDLLLDIEKYTKYEKLQKKLADTLQSGLAKYKYKLLDHYQDSLNNELTILNKYPDDYADVAKDTLADKLYSDKKNVITDSIALLQAKTDSLQNYINKKWAEIQSLKKKKEYFDKLKKKYDDIKSTIDKVKDLDADKLEVVKNPSAIINDKAKYDKFLKDENLLTTKDKILNTIKTLNIGKSVTNVSEYTLYNVPINGATVEIAPSKVYMLFSRGNVDNTINYNTGAQGGRSLTTAGLGYGNKENAHLYVYYLEGNDNNVENVTNFNVNTLAGNNKVVSLSGKIATKKNTFSVELDVAGSQYSLGDYSQSIAIVGEESGTSRQWFQNIITQRSPNANTTVGYAGKIKLTSTLFKGFTTVSSTYKRINSSFRTFGNPYLVRDISGLDLGITQSIFKKRIKATAIIKYNVTGLKDSKNLTRYTLQGGFNIVANFPRYPLLRLSYIPNFQQLDSIQLQTNTFNCNSIYNFRTGKIKHTFSANWLIQNGKGQYINSNYKVNSFTITNTMQFEKLLNAGFSYNHSITRSSLTNILVIKSIEANCGIVLFKKVITKSGINYNLAASQNKFGGYAEASINIGKNLVFKVRADRNVYTNNTIDNTVINKPSFNEWLVRTTLNIIW